MASNVLAAVERVGSSGRYILGREVERFERALAEYWGVEHAIGVGNGMDAIEIALRCLDIRAGGKVLTTPFSAFATILAILRAGGLPVFVDVDDNGNIDLDQCRDVLMRDRSIRFCVPVHLYGNPVDLEKLGALRKDFDLRLVEDCAQAIGARDRGRAVGTAGQMAASSFYPTKNLGAFGDGGAVLTNDAALAGRAKRLRNYGQSSLYQHDERGLNSRLDELHAAILLDALLPNLQDWTQKRRAAAIRYRAEINNPALRSLTTNDAAEPAWHLFPLFTPKRDALREHLKNAGIESSIHYPRIIPDQKALQQERVYEVAVESRNARSLAATEISIPIHPFLEEGEITAIVRAINNFGV
ncbi:MAG TPA: DegT/DnrJ/EryC1/StrS family aminotransferase [Candidatus Acidoferrum sp.]|nr:DegT/DnrJ/EryC1/StrS family aminotransferase [Candidatus Acidoferrum sp.]